MNVNPLFLLPMLAAAPYAMIDTRDIPAADIKHSQIYIRAIDGKAYMDNPVEKKVTPGVRWVVMTRQKSSKSGMKKRDEQSLYLLAKPCIRYYVAGGGEAGENNNDSPNFNPKWTVVIRKVEPISGCKTKEQIEQEKIEKKSAAKDKQIKQQETALEAPMNNADSSNQ